MQFVSTRGQSPPVSFTEAFAHGLAPDGGLYVPESLPAFPPRYLAGTDESLDEPLPYPKLAYEFLKLFDTDHSHEELEELVDRSHENFDQPDNAAPLRQLDDNLFVLELFHGPTLAFKDFGLQLVGNLFEDQIRRTGQPINVLGATSGDTGSAAIHGLANKKSVNVFILYPKGRISELQERQMTCTGAPNIFPIAIEGSFDDAQDIVKDLFNDLDLKERLRLSAVNSINIARILAQSVYYFDAWNQLPERLRARAAGANTSPVTDFCVPTGNFGNIFAGWMAAQMGLPASRFVIATNQNDILYRLFTTGEYKQGDVHPSLAPSMDIQVASNFERFLYYLLDGNTSRVRDMMHDVKTSGDLVIPNFDPGLFSATRTNDAEILAIIKDIHRRYDYIADPHTACGFAHLLAPESQARSANESSIMLVLGTAHPAKFPDTIQTALGTTPIHPALEALKERTPTSYSVAPDSAAVRDFLTANSAT